MTFLLNAKRVFDKEILAVQLTRDTLGESFELICQAIEQCTGRVIVTGMGKSGHVCRKIAATMQSLGIRAQFMHPGEALHGDLGMLAKEDVVIAVSNSGETDEVLGLIPTIQKIGASLYCIVGRKNSTLGKFSICEIVLPTFEEAYLGSLVPTSSTTATLVLGDAIAIAVAEKRGFTSSDFGVFHPNGLLGKRLTLRVKSLMVSGEDNAVISQDSTVEQAIFEMCRKPIGGVNIIAEDGTLCGIFTDGDFRRLYKGKKEAFDTIPIQDVMTQKPITLSPERLVSDVISELKQRDLTVSFYPVVDNGILVGSLRAIDISKSGLL